MARFLLGWELGAGRGHLVRMAATARLLAEAGHEVVVAPQRLGADLEFPATASVWQAPVWPRLLSNVGGVHGPSPQTMGDILHRLGLDRDQPWAALLQAWDAILHAVKPDAVAADFAPALLGAARGRVPTLLCAHAFDGVPSHLPDFPSITGKPAAQAEAPMLDRVNRGLARIGQGPLERLPQIFEADGSVVGSFVEFDFYADHRRVPLAPPSLGQPIGQAGSGDEVFVYSDMRLLQNPELWQGLASSGLPVRAHIANAGPGVWAELERAGILVEQAPVPFTRIAERSRIVVTHGGVGLVSSAAVAGLPVVVVHYDLEKRINGEAVARLGIGGHVAADLVRAEPFAASLRALHANEQIRRRSLELAPGFRARLEPPHARMAADALVALAG